MFQLFVDKFIRSTGPTRCPSEPELCDKRLGVSALNEARGDFRRGLAPKDGCKLCSGFLEKEASA